MNIPGSIATLLIGIAVTIVSLWYGQNHGLMPVAASTDAPLVDGLFDIMMTIGTGLFLLVQGALVYSFFKFRREPGDDTDGPYIEGNIPLEILWTSIPAVIVLGIAVYSFEIYNSMGGLDPMDHSVAHHSQPTHEMAKMPGAAIAGTLTDTTIDPVSAPLEPAAIPESIPGTTSAPQEMTIQAAGLQYAWIFTYPDSGVVAGELHVPVGTRIKLAISANDVLHAFWVPEYRVKQDAIPGTPTELAFTPSRTGEYPVICAELCGPYHGAMKTKVIAETPADFNAWIASQKVASAAGLEDAIALTAAEKPVDQFLAPFVAPLGVDAATLQQLHSAHHPSAS
ncbi:cytochrome c oxidase subunit II [Phormidium sp. CLA17]|uniref:cytochrome c oxidase subunit II n=1 Tax=Leptolyngbya sp. Cla-17 TaxID=2803751 RepID=UPI001490A9E3|nr:cytochrome c oxidase subunit II [Leptolyngbya sp. Cla-17]MBM0740174.1 cytochrome c oxidase subunit II [Leptolyngbya sp. Cla-17]